MTVSEAKEFKVASVMCLEDVMMHTRYFFKKMFKRKFLVNDHHDKVCKVLNLILAGLLTKVIINIAPRYSKTELAVKNFVSNGFAQNPMAQFIHLSYSDALVQTNSDGIKAIMKTPEYQAMFPDVRISNKNDSKKKWYTTKGGIFYAASTAGQVTGHGAGAVPEEADEWQNFEKELKSLLDAYEINSFEQKAKFMGALIIDDPIKPEDAFSDVLRKKINDRWDSTIKNRVNSMRTPILIMGQRTHEEDLSGYVMKQDGHTTDIEEAIKNPDIWYVLSIPAIIEDDKGNEISLWPSKWPLEKLKKMRETDQLNFDTQYMQDPTPLVGLLYKPFREYTVIPITQTSVRKAYVDTADEGDDYLCAVSYIETDEGMYITDVYYTKEAMETTEVETAIMFAKHKLQIARIESNNGGRGFARNVERQTKLLKNLGTEFIWFHQSNNKKVRIFNKSGEVTRLIFMPVDWAKKWPLFHKHVTKYRKEGKNPHDDAPDVLTGMCEYYQEDIPAGSDDWADSFL